MDVCVRDIIRWKKQLENVHTDEFTLYLELQTEKKIIVDNSCCFFHLYVYYFDLLRLQGVRYESACVEEGDRV